MHRYFGSLKKTKKFWATGESKPKKKQTPMKNSNRSASYILIAESK